MTLVTWMLKESPREPEVHNSMLLPCFIMRVIWDLKVYSQWAIVIAFAIAIFAPLKWILLNTMVLFTVNVCDSVCDNDIAIAKSDMGVAPISSGANST